MMDRPILRAVLAGCGSMSTEWLRSANLVEGLQVAGLVDLNPEAARKRADEFAPEAAVGSDLGAMLDELAPDVVFDCTIPEAHCGVTLEALRHGCHVLGEKPLADSLENARRMLDAAREAGRIYAVIQNRRYNLRVRQLQAFLRSGAIGPLTTINSDFFIGAHFGGFRDRMEHPLLLDMAIHTFDLARFLTGADPVSVYCKEWNPAGSWYDHSASAVAVFELTGGIVYTYRGSWCSEGLNTSWDAEWQVIGAQGSAQWDGLESLRAESVAEPGGFRYAMNEVEIPPVAPSDRDGGHIGLIRELMECVHTGATPQTICTDNIKSLAMVFAAIDSAREGREVAVRW
ncbi:MAG: oxidoreductase domain protein [Armatimonadetes bacterium]|nr:oxidoreductase domain protein [Armatimonadota bacterium]